MSQFGEPVVKDRAQVKINPTPIPEAQMLPLLGQRVEELAGMLAHGERPPEGRVILEPHTQVAGHPVGGVDLCVMHDVIYDPRTGLIVSRDGGIPASAAEVLRGGTKAALRRLGARTSGLSFAFDRPLKDWRNTATLWLGGGSLRNYGHFIFDSLTALTELRRLGVTQFTPPVARKLATWQGDLCRRAGVFDAIEIATRPVHIETAIFTTAFDHYLHRNHDMLKGLAAQIGRPDSAPEDGAVLYLSRRGYSGRIMLGERDLEAALLTRGVEILRPERLSVDEQIAHMARARMVIGASGAALANMIFLGPGARVVEIRPGRLDETWIDLGCANLGLAHAVIRASDDLPQSRIPLISRVKQAPRRMTGRYNYAYEVDIDAVVTAIDA